MKLPTVNVFHVHGPRLGVGYGIGLIAALAAIVAAGAVYARDGAVAGWEISILKFFNGFPDWLTAPMWVVQQPGVLFFPFAAGAVIVALSRRWHYALPFLLLPVYKLSLEKELVKTRVDRSRPYTSVGPEIQARGQSLLDEPSFPSGHATTAVACGILIVLSAPQVAAGAGRLGTAGRRRSSVLRRTQHTRRDLRRCTGNRVRDRCLAAVHQPLGRRRPTRWHAPAEEATRAASTAGSFRSWNGRR